MDRYAGMLLSEYINKNDTVSGVSSGFVEVSTCGQKLGIRGYDYNGVLHKVWVACWVAGHLLVRKANSYVDLRDHSEKNSWESLERAINLKVVDGKLLPIIPIHTEINDEYLEEWKLVIATKGIA